MGFREAKNCFSAAHLNCERATTRGTHRYEVSDGTNTRVWVEGVPPAAPLAAAGLHPGARPLRIEAEFDQLCRKQGASDLRPCKENDL